MDDVIQIIGGGAGYAILALASVVFWRMFRYLEKDRDYWRDQALDRKKALDATLDHAEVLVDPLKTVEKLTKRGKVASEGASRIKQLEAVVEFLMSERKAQ